LPDFSGLIANNTCAYSSNQQGILIFKDGTGGSGTNIRIENNIFFQVCFAPESLQSCAASARTSVEGTPMPRLAIRLLDMGAIGMTFKNNVVYDTDHLAGTNPLECQSGNDLHNTAWCVSNGWVGQYSGNITTTNPSMTNASTTALPASPDFHLQAGSVAIDAGLDFSGTFTNDYDNVTRSVPYDVGAYEAGGDSTPPAPPTGLTVQ
jgi:hypothetical protein